MFDAISESMMDCSSNFFLMFFMFDGDLDCSQLHSLANHFHESRSDPSLISRASKEKSAIHLDKLTSLIVVK